MIDGGGAGESQEGEADSRRREKVLNHARTEGNKKKTQQKTRTNNNDNKQKKKKTKEQTHSNAAHSHARALHKQPMDGEVECSALTQIPQIQTHRCMSTQKHNNDQASVDYFERCCKKVAALVLFIIEWYDACMYTVPVLGITPRGNPGTLVSADQGVSLNNGR